ncbi:sensor histidine kinase [Abyssalbus ytuae]|uniref:Histidine kinase n=1 Tax=Abyssalbus ytuae TaxID=2926907 RepID=A0A9E7D312_9FLAO|nr:histidine kinase [Abyssalbus ytuae]UOB18773.1 histidine kinase [Abyssalbus ytuae]
MIERKNIKEVTIHAIIWIIIFLISTLEFYSQFKSIPYHIYTRLVIYIIVFYLNYLFLIPRLLLKGKLYNYLFFCVAMIITFLFLTRFIEPEPVFKLRPGNFEGLANRPELPEPPKMKSTLFRYVFPFLTMGFFIIAGTTIKIYSDWKKNIELRKQVESEKIHSELQFLKTQLNPHFLFNSLNTIYSLSVSKSAYTSEAILNVAELMRYMLYEANKDLVPLSKEIDYIKNYIQLQRLRLLNSEQVSIQIRGNYENKFIQPLLLISFIENAFKYGTDYKGNTVVKININVEGNTLYFNISNIIGTHKKDISNSGIGLKNIKNRLKLLYPDSHELEIVNDGENYTVNLRLNNLKG